MHQYDDTLSGDSAEDFLGNEADKADVATEQSSEEAEAFEPEML
jgi:hypothetical protein